MGQEGVQPARSSCCQRPESLEVKYSEPLGGILFEKKLENLGGVKKCGGAADGSCGLELLLLSCIATRSFWFSCERELVSLADSICLCKCRDPNLPTSAFSYFLLFRSQPPSVTTPLSRLHPAEPHAQCPPPLPHHFPKSSSSPLSLKSCGSLSTCCATSHNRLYT
jgi:hypothetical protein